MLKLVHIELDVHHRCAPCEHNRRGRGSRTSAEYQMCIGWSLGEHKVNIDSRHYNEAIMGAIASQITSLTIVYSIVYSDADQRKHVRSASLAFVRGIHRGSVNSPHKWPVTRKMFPFDDVIMVPEKMCTRGILGEYCTCSKCVQLALLCTIGILYKWILLSKHTT